MSEGTEPSEAGAEAEAEASGGAEQAEAKPNKLQALMVEYGVIAVVVLLGLSLLTFLAFFIPAFMAIDEDLGLWARILAAAGVAVIPWGAGKFIRIPIAIALTPVVAAVWHKVRGRPKKGEAKR